MSGATCGSVTFVWRRPRISLPLSGLLVVPAKSSTALRYATNFLYRQRRPSWRRQTCPRTSRPVMLRLGMMTRRRCQVVGLAVRRSNPNLRMVMAVNLIVGMLTHSAQAARCRHRHSGHLGAPITTVAPRRDREYRCLEQSRFDPRDTRIIANRAATVVNEIRILSRAVIVRSLLRYFCPAMLHDDS